MYRKAETVTPVSMSIEDVIVTLEKVDDYFRPLVGEELFEFENAVTEYRHAMNELHSRKMLYGTLQLLTFHVNSLLSRCHGQYRLVLGRDWFSGECKLSFIDDSRFFRTKISTGRWKVSERFSFYYALGGFDKLHSNRPGRISSVIQTFKEFVLSCLTNIRAEAVVNRLTSA